MKKSLFAIILLQCSLPGFSFTVTGNAFLDNSTDHSGIQIKFVPKSPSAILDSTLTLTDGSFKVDVNVGLYDIEYSKSGYQIFFSNGVLINEDISLSDMTISPNVLEPQNVKFVSGDIHGTWYGDTVYHVIGNITVDSGKVLNVLPGTKVLFVGYYNIKIHGQLIARGSAVDKIIFTSGKDNKGKSDWKSLTIKEGASGTSYLEHTILEYAEFGVGNMSKLMIANSVFRHITAAAISVERLGDLSIRDSEIYDCGRGIINSGGVTKINTTVFHEITNDAIYIYLPLENTEIIDNLFYNTERAIFAEFGNEEVHIRFNKFYKNVEGIFLTFADCGACTIGMSEISNNSFYNIGRAIFLSSWSKVTDRIEIKKNVFLSINSLYLNESSNIVPFIEANLFHNNPINNLNDFPEGFGQKVLTNNNGDSTDIYFNLFQDPKVYSLDPDDPFFLHLKPDSPARNAAIDSSDLGALPYLDLVSINFDLQKPQLQYFDYDSVDLSFTWNSYEDSVESPVFYRVQILEDNKTIYTSPQLQDTAFNLSQRGILEPRKAYKWRLLNISEDNAIVYANDTLTFLTPNLPPSPFNLIAPLKSEDVNVTDLEDLTLSWEPNLDKDEVTFSISLASQGQDTLIRVSGQSEVNLTDFLVPDTDYSWYVTATDGSEFSYSDTAAFTTPNVLPSVFDLLSPSNGIRLQDFGQTTFKWNSSEDTDPFHYELSITGPGFDTLIQTLSDTTFLFDEVSFLLPNTAYSWQVKASDDTDVTASQVRTFSTPNILPSPFSLVGPSNETISHNNSLQFTWQASKDQEQIKYDLHVFNEEEKYTYPSISSTSHTIVDKAALKSFKEYNWTVIASDGTDLVSSDTLQFQTGFVYALPTISLSNATITANNGSNNAIAKIVRSVDPVGISLRYVLINENDLLFEIQDDLLIFNGESGTKSQWSLEIAVYAENDSLFSRTFNIKKSEASFSTDLNFGTSVENYAFVSFPIATSPLSNCFGEQDLKAIGVDWKIWTIQGGAYAELKSPSNTIEQGKGYWFIARNKIEPTIKNAELAPLNSKGEFELDLKPGWNIVGNPFMKSLSWSEVIDYNISNGNTAAAQLTKNGQKYEKGYVTTDIIETYKGILIKSLLDNEMTLYIPQTVSSSSVSARLSSTERNKYVDAKNWKMGLDLSQGTNSFAIGGLGFHPEASIEEDTHDQFVPPSFQENALFMRLHNQQSLSQNIIPFQNNTHLWMYDVIGKTGEPCQLSWDNQFIDNTNLELTLELFPQRQIIDMGVLETANFTLHPNQKVILHYGNQKTKNEEEMVQLNLFPVPAKGILNVLVSSKYDFRDIPVTVNLYDRIDREVRTLKTTLNAPATLDIANLANGIYLCRIEAGSFYAEIRKLIVQR